MGRFLKTLFTTTGLVLALQASSLWAAAGSIWGELKPNAAGLVPDPADLSFISYVNNTDEVLHTENSYNSAVGLSQGYVLHEGKGYWFVNFMNFPQALDGQSYTVVFTDAKNGTQATLEGTVPGTYTNIPSIPAFTATAAPAAPGNFRAVRNGKDVTLSWDAAPGETYRVYRTQNPSGFKNGASNGIYHRIADGVVGGTYTDDVKVTSPAWYLLVPETKTGVRGAHSVEVSVPAILEKEEIQKDVLQGAPKVQQPGVSLPQNGVRQ